MTYVIAEPCVDLLDKACIEECPVDCIYEGARMLYIHPDECVDCGACEPVCPVEAIYYEDDVKEEWAAYTKANVDFFDELGSPGGASKVGKVEADPQWIKDLPPMNTTSTSAERHPSTSPTSVGLPRGRQRPRGGARLRRDRRPLRRHAGGPCARRGARGARRPAVDVLATRPRTGRRTAWRRSRGAGAALPRRRRPGFDVLPTIGSKELVAWLPTLLAIPRATPSSSRRSLYPTYEVGALLAGAEFVRDRRADGLAAGRPR